MKRGMQLSVFAFICSIGALGQATKPTLPRTVTEVFDRSVAGAEKATIALAEAMPEEKYGFVPENGEFKGVRNFGELVKHVAVDNYVNGAALLNEKLPIDAGEHENGPSFRHYQAGDPQTSA